LGPERAGAAIVIPSEAREPYVRENVCREWGSLASLGMTAVIYVTG